MALGIVTGLAALQQVGQAAKSVLTASKSLYDTRDSLISYTGVARVEPITLIDNDLAHSELLPDTMQSLLSIFAGYYLQAYTLSTMSVGKVDFVKHLDRLNPNRDPINATGQYFGIESLNTEYKYRLPKMNDVRRQELGMEAWNGMGSLGGQQPPAPPPTPPSPSRPTTVGHISHDRLSDLKEISNLSVGKVFNVELRSDEQTATIPISIRLLANMVPVNSLVHVLSAGSKDRSFSERWHQYKLGHIDLIKDLILCQDLIDEHKKHLLDDKTNMLAAILDRRRNSAVSSILNGPDGFSLAVASNIAVLSKSTATALELKLLGKLSNFAIRQKMFEKTYLMLLAVVDPESNRVIFYHRGIAQPTHVSHRDMKMANKGAGPNIVDILNALRGGLNPSL